MRVIFSVLLLSFCKLLFSQNENISEGTNFDGEPYLSIDPLNPQHIVVCWMGFDGLDLIKMKNRVSFDGGTTWSDIIEIPHEEFGNTSADPSMSFDSEGHLFICYIDYDPFFTSGGVYIRQSTDGGLIWGDAVEAIDAFDDGFELPVDRPWMVIDNSGGPFDGRIYITTKPAPFVPIPNSNYLVISNDGGESFSAWKHLDAPGWSIGGFIQAPMATPAVSDDGVFHCVYPAWEITENLLPRFIHTSSNDGGETFSYHEIVESAGGDLVTDTLPKLGYLLITDPSNYNHLVFTCILKSLGDADIFILESFDAGATWSDKIRVNDDAVNTGVMQDMVWADFNSTGDLLVTWRDRRNAADTGFIAASEFWAAVRWKDSVSFSPNFRISDQLVEFNDVLKGNGNDFMCSELVGDTAYAVWGEARDEYLNIWFTKLSAHTGTGTGIQNITSEHRNIPVFPNPANDELYLMPEDIMAVEIFNSAGELVMYVENLISDHLDISSLKAGNYMIRIRTTEGILSYQFIKQ